MIKEKLRASILLLINISKNDNDNEFINLLFKNSYEDLNND